MMLEYEGYDYEWDMTWLLIYEYDWWDIFSAPWVDYHYDELI